MVADLGNVVVLGIDPGQTTGWCAVGVPPEVLSGARSPGDTLNRIVMSDGLFDYGQIDGAQDENKAVRQLEDLALIDYPDAAVVIEDFIIDFRKITKQRSALSPVRITAKLEYALWAYEENQTGRIFRQMPSLAKTTMTDDRLKELGLYDPHSGEHARDAMRHAYYFLRNCRGNSIAAQEFRWRAWPHR